MKSFWKTLAIDLLLLVLLFGLFIFCKSYIGSFLDDVNNVDLDLQEIESELDNQSTLQIEGFVENYEGTIRWMYFFTIFIVPLICYLLIFGLLVLNVAIVKKNYRKIGLDLIFALPLLLIFYIIVSYFIENLSSLSFFVSFILVVLMVVYAYIWFGRVFGDYKIFLRKFYFFIPLFLIYVLLFGFSIIITGYVAALSFVGGLLALEFFRYFLFICVLLVGIQFLREYIIKKVNS